MAQQQAEVRERLAELRDLHGLTQEQAATKIGVNLRQYQRWEAGDSKPYARNLQKVAEAYEISTDELLGLGESRVDRMERLLYAIARELGVDPAEAIRQRLHEAAEQDAERPAGKPAASRDRKRRGQAS